MSVAKTLEFPFQEDTKGFLIQKDMLIVHTQEQLQTDLQKPETIACDIF